MTRGRQRKKLQQQARALAEKEAAAEAASKGQGPVTIGSDPKRLLSDMDLIGQAIDGDWPVAANVKQIVVVALANAVIEGSGLDATEKDKERLFKASGTLIKADVSNIARKRAGSHGGGTQVNVNVGVQVNQAVQTAVGTEPEYLDWVRQRELAEGGNAHVVGANGFAAKVPDSAPRLGVGPGSNGHH